MVKQFNIVAAGFVADGRIMDNGERRIRIKAPDGTAYIRTEMDRDGAWQNAHYHRGVFETYIVERGWIVAAEHWKLNQRCAVYVPGGIFTSRQYVEHNILMPRGAVIHTVQHGRPIGNPDKNGNDWYPASADFDAWTKSLTIEGICKELGVELPAVE